MGKHTKREGKHRGKGFGRINQPKSQRKLGGLWEGLRWRLSSERDYRSKHER